MAKNSNLTAAKKAKNDEFYTQLTDIEKELVHYHDKLRDKIIFCNCDDPAVLEDRLPELLQDEDITNQKGLYEFLLGGETEDRLLHIREFSEKDKRRKYEEQGGTCVYCGEYVEYEACEADHVTPWSQGGHTEYGNLQILCKKCNRSKIEGDT